MSMPLTLVRLLLLPFKVALHTFFDVMDWLVLDETPVFGELPEKEKPKRKNDEEEPYSLMPSWYAERTDDVIAPRLNVVQGNGYVSLEPPLRRWSSVPIDGEYFDENTIFGPEEMLGVYGYDQDGIYHPRVHDNTEWTKNMIQYLDDQGLSGDDR